MKAGFTGLQGRRRVVSRRASLRHSRSSYSAKRGIQYAAASRFITDALEYWIAGQAGR